MAHPPVAYSIGSVGYTVHLGIFVDRYAAFGTYREVRMTTTTTRMEDPFDRDRRHGVSLSFEASEVVPP